MHGQNARKKFIVDHVRLIEHVIDCVRSSKKINASSSFVVEGFADPGMYLAICNCVKKTYNNAIATYALLRKNSLSPSTVMIETTMRIAIKAIK